MGRDLRDDARELPVERPVDGVRSSGSVRGRARLNVDIRGRTYALWPSEIAALQHVGMFRIVDVKDLEQCLFQGSRTRVVQDLRELAEQQLIRRDTLTDRHGGRRTVVSLTETGAGVARATLADPDQAVYHGFVKPREVAHDAALYRMFDAERQRIEQAGGRVRIVTLDYELKRQVYAPTQRVAPGAAPSPEELTEAARRVGLKVVDGTVQIPDLRIEFEDAAGERGRVDLELATEHYKPGQLAAKARAGFTIYAPADQSARLSAALEERDLMVEIFSL